MRQISSLPLRVSLASALTVCFALASVPVSVPVSASAQAPRPKITGISHIAVYASDPRAAGHYYEDVVGAPREDDPENPQGARYAINAFQFVEVLPLPANAALDRVDQVDQVDQVDRLDHTAWNTDNAEGLRRNLAAKGWETPSMLTRYADGSKTFRVKDPEGNMVEFVQPPPNPKAPAAPNAIGHRIIHLGFLVHSRAAEDKFYIDLLGFRPYWFGGMQDGKVDWVSQQCPDSHDWLEYMLTSGQSGAGIPATMSQQALGVLNHLSIGVISVPEAYKRLAAEGRLTGRADKAPKIGRDGKYQFNLYDPDGTRLELMEFRATEKPCCSPFTAEDPKAE